MELESVSGVINTSGLTPEALVAIEKLNKLQEQVSEAQAVVKQHFDTLANKLTKKYKGKVVNQRNIYKGDYVNNIYVVSKIRVVAGSFGKPTCMVDVVRKDDSSLGNSFPVDWLYFWPDCLIEN